MTTLVTGFWDLSARKENPEYRSTQEYLARSEYVLSLNINLVVFIDPTFHQFVRDKRQKYLDKTRIIEMPFDQLPYAYLVSEVKEIRDECMTKYTTPGNPYAKYTPDYFVVIWSKLPLLSRVCKENPFKSTYFGWIDFGIRHVAMVPVDDIYSPLPNSNMIRIGQVRYFTQDDIDINKLPLDSVDMLDCGAIAAGVFMGPRYPLMLLDYLFDEELDAILTKRRAFSEQFVLARLIKRYPDLFSIYFGQYASLLVNHRYLHDAYEHVISAITLATSHEDHATVCRIGEYLVESYHQGTIFPNEKFALALDKYYTSSYYHYHPDQTIPRSIVHLFDSLKKTSDSVKSYYDTHASRLHSNFSFLRQ